MAEIPHHEYVELKLGAYGLPDHDSLDERIARAEHDAGKPIGGLGGQSHCWLCRRQWEQENFDEYGQRRRRSPGMKRKAS